MRAFLCANGGLGNPLGVFQLSIHDCEGVLFLGIRPLQYLGLRVARIQSGKQRPLVIHQLLLFLRDGSLGNSQEARGPLADVVFDHGQREFRGRDRVVDLFHLRGVVLQGLVKFSRDLGHFLADQLQRVCRVVFVSREPF